MKTRTYGHICDNIENVENYEKAKADNFEGWICHHRLETHFSDGIERPKDAQISQKELIILGIYYHRPAEELIFLTTKEHQNAHFRGKHHSEETKEKLSEARKGKYMGEDNPMYGKHHTEKSRKKMSDARKGKPTWIKGKHHSEESKKRMVEAHKGQPAWNKGKKMSEDFCRKASEAAKQSEARKGRHWFNDGTKSVMSKTCPKGFIPGRLR